MTLRERFTIASAYVGVAVRVGRELTIGIGEAGTAYYLTRLAMSRPRGH